ncbi:hypothetical protein FS842_008170 [Serendipita sp. 407]|nr:hypothetical protein FS842_008170 [Serendipita sp. 407]
MWPFLVLGVLLSNAGRAVAQYSSSNTYSFLADMKLNFVFRAGEWETVHNPNRDSVRITGLETQGTKNGQMLFLFNAFMFSLHITHPPGSSVLIWIDGKLAKQPYIPETETVFQNISVVNSGVEGMSLMEGPLVSGDHQLLFNVSTSGEDLVVFDRLDILASRNTSIPANYSIVATSVASTALIDDTSTLLEYSDSGWDHKQDPLFWGNTSSATRTPGAWVQISLVGTGLWVYGTIPVEGSVFSVEVVKKYGQETTRNVTTHNVMRPGLDVPLYQAPLFVESSLSYANMYKYNITLLSGSLNIDFIRVIGKLVPSDFDDFDTSGVVTSTESTRSPLDESAIIPIVCIVPLIILGGVWVLLYRKGYLRRSKTFGASRTKTVEKDDDPVIEPFYFESSNGHSQLTRLTKGSSRRLSDSVPFGPPSSSMSLIDSSYFTIPVSGAPTLITSAAAEATVLRLRPSHPEEEGDQTLSLSHSDLARVFQRAEELRRNGGNHGSTDSGLDPPLESLARRLASGEPVTG